MSEPCFRCGEPKPVDVYLRDEKGDHPLCETCHDTWAESDEEWPSKPNKKEGKWCR